MEVSPNALRKETVRSLLLINAEMEKYEEEADQLGETPFVIKDRNGRPLYATLMAAKMSALNTLALLRGQ